MSRHASEGGAFRDCPNCAALRDELEEAREALAVIRLGEGRAAAAARAAELAARFDLTIIEAKIFAVMVAASGRDVDKDRIFEAVYGDEPDPPMTKIIDIHIFKLRKKLSRHGVTIETIWGGVGWRISDAGQRVVAARERRP